MQEEEKEGASTAAGDDGIKSKTQSEAWPHDHRSNIKTSSKTHDLCKQFIQTMLSKMSVSEFVKSHIELRELVQNDMDEIKNLHQEWFPLDYPDKFY